MSISAAFAGNARRLAMTTRPRRLEVDWFAAAMSARSAAGSVARKRLDHSGVPGMRGSFYAESPWSTAFLKSYRVAAAVLKTSPKMTTLKRSRLAKVSLPIETSSPQAICARTQTAPIPIAQPRKKVARSLTARSLVSSSFPNRAFGANLTRSVNFRLKVGGDVGVVRLNELEDVGGGDAELFGELPDPHVVAKAPVVDTMGSGGHILPPRRWNHDGGQDVDRRAERMCQGCRLPGDADL